MTQSERQIFDMVRAIARRWLGFQVSHFLATTLLVLAVWLTLMIVVDNLAMLSPQGLLTGWALLAAAVGLWTLAALYRLTLGRPRRADFALMYEARVPGQHNRLINSVQFLQDARTVADPLARAAVDENAAALDLRTAPRAIDFAPLRRAIGLLLTCIVALGLYAALRPQWTLNAVQRLANPLDPAGHLLSAEMSITPGNTLVIEGQELRIQASVRMLLPSYFPKTVEVEYRLPKLDWKRARMTAAAAGEFAYTMRNVWQPIEYRVRAGRSVSRDFQVTIRPRPRVEHLQATVTPPAYTGRPAVTLPPHVGNLAGLAGSTAELHVTATAELAEGAIELSDHTRVPLEITAGAPRTARAAFPLVQSGTYTIHLVDREGLTIVNPPQFALSVQADEAPLATITRPGRDLVLPADARLDVALEADDDLGVARLALQTRSGSGDWKELRHWDVTKLDQRHIAQTARIALAEMKLKPNDVLLYRAVASDHRQPEPNLGVGRTWSITLTAPGNGENLGLAHAKRLAESLEQILALQKQNRGEFALSAPLDSIRARQDQIRNLTLNVIAQQQNTVAGMKGLVGPLSEIANGLMLQCGQSLGKFLPAAADAEPQKQAILGIMDQIIARLEEILGKVQKAITAAEKAFDILAKLSPEERERALQSIRDLVEKLRKFIPEQDKVIDETKELVRKAENFTDPDLRKLDQLRGTEDKWDKVFAGSVSDLAKLTEQGLADRTIANDYKEMVEKIEEASKNLHPKPIEIAVPLEQAGRELAQKLEEDMEMWLPNSPDFVKWAMEEPLDHPQIPMAKLPDNLSDMIGDLMDEQDALNEMAQDVTSGWADSLSKAGWGVGDGPISSFSAKGKTGNQLPNKQELSGRSGDGRSGASQGQMVEDTAKGLPGNKTPTRITNDPYEQGVVKELQQMATTGATGGGKTRGSGQEGLQGESPPPLREGMKTMEEWQKRIRQKAERMAGQLKAGGVDQANLEKAIALMKDVEQQAAAGRYNEMFKVQQMVLQQLRTTNDETPREGMLQVDRASHLPPDQRRKVLDAMDEPMPQEYQGAVQRYFQKLSEAK